MDRALNDRLGELSGSRWSDHRLLSQRLFAAAAARNETKCATKTGHSELRFTLLSRFLFFFSPPCDDLNMSQLAFVHELLSFRNTTKPPELCQRTELHY